MRRASTSTSRPELMQVTHAQEIPNWDTQRIVGISLGPPRLDAPATSPTRSCWPARSPKRGSEDPSRRRRKKWPTTCASATAWSRSTRWTSWSTSLGPADQQGFYAAYSVDETWWKDPFIRVRRGGAAHDRAHPLRAERHARVPARADTTLQVMATLDKLTNGRMEIVVSTGNFGLMHQHGVDWADRKPMSRLDRGDARHADLHCRGRDHVRGRPLHPTTACTRLPSPSRSTSRSRWAP